MQESQDLEAWGERLREPSPPESVLYRLSNLHGDVRARWTEVWATLPAERRQEVVARLVEMSEADFEVDFSEVFKACLKDEDAHVRCSAVEGLWEIEDVALVRPLIELLREDPVPIVREAAAISLSRFALQAELGRLQPHLGEQVWDALWNKVHDLSEDVDVRRRAIESLAYFDRPEVAQVIRQAYNDEDDTMRISAVFAMGRSADDEWANQVIDELLDDDPAMRYEAARACGTLQLYPAVPTLGRMVADPDLEVKLMAVWALGQIGGHEAQRVLEICIEMGDEALSDAAAEALDELDFNEGALDFPLLDISRDDADEEDDLLDDEADTEGPYV
jgi:HEAT repeat protein